MESYCVKEKRKTGFVEPSGYQTTKMEDYCFIAIALLAELKKQDSLKIRETKSPPTRWGLRPKGRRRSRNWRININRFDSCTSLVRKENS